MEIDQEILNEIKNLAQKIVTALKDSNSVFINVQIEEEYSQYDVLFSYNFVNYGRHQRGILGDDLIISVIGFGSFGFKIDIADTDPSYYHEKLGVHSNYLAYLFNEVRKQLKNSK